MIYIDAREGVSGDMLLAAMIGLLQRADTERTCAHINEAAENQGLELRLIEMRDGEDSGLAVSYIGVPQQWERLSREQAFSKLREMSAEMGAEPRIGEDILGSIFKAEAEAHGLAEGDVHLHEIGRPQALLNIAGIGFAASLLMDAGAEGFVCSSITTGRGTVAIAHGAIRVPAPASRILLRGMRHTMGDSPGERATPTGIAALKVLAKSQSDDRPENYRKKSMGFGTKRFGARLGRIVLIWP